MKFEGIDYNAVLADLEAQRDAIDKAIAGIQMMLRNRRRSIVGSSEEATESIPPDVFSEMTIPNAIRKYLSVERKPRSTSEIAAALKAGGIRTGSQNFYSTVSTALARMLKQENGVSKRNKKWALRERKPATGTTKIEEGKSKEPHGEAEASGKEG